jgi:cell wall assembly regulator SMI1
MPTVKDILDEIERYSSDLRLLYPGAREMDIRALERSMSMKLPEDFRQFLTNCNGFSILSDRLYGIHADMEAIDLLSVYKWERNESGNPIRRDLLPIMPDGEGNHYCLDLANGSTTTAPVVFWQHDYDYEAHSDSPDVVAGDFVSFLQNILEQMHEDYGYDGQRRQRSE